MNIQEIKLAAGITGSMPMVQQFETKEGQTVETPTEWVAYWDNDRRVRLVMHQDVLKQIQAEPTKADMAVKTEVVAANETRAAYTRYVVITPRNIVATL